MAIRHIQVRRLVQQPTPIFMQSRSSHAVCAESITHVLRPLRYPLLPSLRSRKCCETAVCGSTAGSEVPVFVKAFSGLGREESGDNSMTP